MIKNPLALAFDHILLLNCIEFQFLVFVYFKITIQSLVSTHLSIQITEGGNGVFFQKEKVPVENWHLLW